MSELSVFDCSIEKSTFTLGRFGVRFAFEMKTRIRRGGSLWRPGVGGPLSALMQVPKNYKKIF